MVSKKFKKLCPYASTQNFLPAKMVFLFVVALRDNVFY